MSAPSLIRRELTNAKIYFIPTGETVDSITVSKTTWPDNAPTTNYTAYELAEIEKVVEELLTTEEKRMLGRVSGGYMQETETHLIGKRWTATTASTSSYLKQLQHGLSAAAATTVAQAPGVKAMLFLDGVFLLEQIGSAGAVVERVQVWARMTLKKTGDTGPDTKTYDVQFEQLYAALNTAVVI
jgi:hypothetical protein